jgi:beta-glucuronidase
VLRDGEGSVLQRYDVHTGIRSLEVRRGRLLLNGRAVDLRGASMHEDDQSRGAALTPDRIRQDFELLRQLGATMTRAHYPMHPLALELADRYGIVVWSEIPVYQMQDRLFRNNRVRRLSLRMVREMVLRDRDHPSVIVWSVGNENTQKPGPGFRRYVRQARRAARRLDPTRLVGLAFPGYPTIGRQSLYATFDALGINDYFGWYPGPDGSIADRAGLGPYLDSLHGYYPRQALFVTEFGAEANRSGPVTEKGTYEFQRDFLAYHLSVYETKPYLNGALVWILRDFRVKPGYDGGNPHPQPPVNFKGLVDDGGDRKPAFSVVEHALQAVREGKR